MAAAIKRRASYVPIDEYEDINLDNFSSFDLISNAKLEKWKRKLTSQSQLLLAQLEEQNFVRVRDKFSFMAGVTNLWFSALLLGWSPAHIPLWYTIKAIVLIIIRFFTFRSQKWQYFLCDLCYYGNLLTIAYIYLFPRSKGLFLASWALANGPLAWAIVTWRNSLVFHSLEKTTSVFIHIWPPLTLFSIRWLYTDPNRFGDFFRVIQPGFFDFLLYGIIAYVIWQTLYYIFVNVLSAEKVKNGYATSFSWLVSEHSKGLIKRAASIFGPRYQLLVFMVLQFIYTVLTMVPCVFFFRFMWIHAAYLALMLSVSVWNGANYYIEVFSRSYIKMLEQMATKKLQKSIENAAADGANIGSVSTGVGEKRGIAN